MFARPPRPARLSKEEWLELEKRTGLRHEYLDGFVYAMAGESKPHNDIVVNSAVALAQKSRAKGCQFRAENVKTLVRYYIPGRGDLVAGPSRTTAKSTGPASSWQCAPKPLRERPPRPARRPLQNPRTQDLRPGFPDEKRVEIYRKTRRNLIRSEPTNAGELEIPCLEERIGLQQVYSGRDAGDLQEPES